LPRYVDEEFEAYLKCGRFEHGFLRVRCESCHAEKLAAFSCKRRGLCPSRAGLTRASATAGAVTLAPARRSRPCTCVPMKRIGR
jgi:hypothetical protein